ncbi:hypothetical protein F5Y05DRAFT_268478 [Hypoxylon sp. FL0543]|nr:hypothetical protein F5Y05DRAFT_268478 [Hypoxylon sp. FL0543]
MRSTATCLKGRLDSLAGLLFCFVCHYDRVHLVIAWGFLADSVASHREEFLGRQSNTSFSQAYLTVKCHPPTLYSYL